MRRVSTSENLTTQVHDVIRDAIVSGEMAPGELHSIYKLADQLGVSRTPVREALVRLEQEGMVEFERNRGVRILTPGTHDLLEIGALRLLLEVPATRQAARRVTPAVLDTLERELAAMEAAAGQDDEPGYMRHDRRFHTTILELSGNRRLASYVEGLRDLTLMRGASTAGRSRSLEDITKEHRVVLDHLAVGDDERAAQAMREHLVHTFRLLLSQEADTDPSGIMLDWVDHT